MRYSCTLFVSLFFLVSQLSGQDTVRVMTYNLLNYGNTTSYCTASNNAADTKESNLRTLIQYVKPSILSVNEVSGSNYYWCQRLLDTVLNQNGRDYYKRAIYVNSISATLINMLYYDSRKFTLHFQTAISTSVRDIGIYKLYYNSPDLAQGDTAFLTCIVAHLKAGSTSSDEQERAAETTLLMDYLNAQGYLENCLVMGDFNVYESSEACFQNLVNHSNAAIRFYDPINKLGSWTNNSSYSAYHTQSAASTSNGCTASGGLDDRFDFILASSYVINGIDKVSYIPSSYTTVGQDGSRFNQAVNDPTNYSAPSLVINALAATSDHLPVYLDLKIDQTVASGIQETFASKYLISNIYAEQGAVYFTLATDQSSRIGISVYTIDGKLIYTDDLSVTQGLNEYSVPVNIYSQQMYFLRLSGASGYLNSKFIVR